MKKYLIVLKGKSNTGKTTSLKLLSKKLMNLYKFQSYEINDCEYREKLITQIQKDKDIFLKFNVNKKAQIIISTGDYYKCIETFLKKFSQNNVFIGITSCQCNNSNNKKYKKIKDFIEKHKNIELIEINNYLNHEYRNILNETQANELFNLINDFLILKKNHIYSMLSDEEKLNLYYLSKNLYLQKNSVIVEYGVFLGGSLQFIINGLKKNKTYKNNYIYAIDNFYIDKSQTYFNDFKNRFKAIGLQNYIKKDKIAWIDYINNSFKKINNLKLIKSSHKEFKLKNKYKISLLHLDLAKRYNAFKEILINLHNNIDSNTMIIHQDFFYVFSGEVIAFLYKMVKENKIEVKFISSFSSIYLINSSISLDDIKKFDISDTDLLVKLIEESIDYFKKDINIWQKTSLYGAIINLLKLNNKNYCYYMNQLKELTNKKTNNHINRMLKQLKDNEIIFKGYL